MVASARKIGATFEVEELRDPELPPAEKVLAFVQVDLPKSKLVIEDR